MLKRFDAFLTNIYIIHRSIQQLKSKVTKKYGLNGNQGIYMLHLLRHPNGMTASQITNYVRDDKAAVSRALSELYKKGYIYYKDYNGTKKYNTPAFLTEKGVKLAEIFQNIACKIVEKAGLAGENEAEREILYNSLKTVASNITLYLNEDVK